MKSSARMLAKMSESSRRLLDADSARATSMEPAGSAGGTGGVGVAGGDPTTVAAAGAAAGVREGGVVVMA